MSKRLGVVLAAPILVSLFFRVWMLGNIPGINGDEAWLGVKAIALAQGETIDWKTNSGNLTDPFYLLPLAALHSLFPGSFVLLRAVAVVSGILLLPLNFFLCRKVFNVQTALLSTLLLAVLPINIIYSRFGWEPSQSVLFSVPVMYGALWFAGTRKRAWLAMSVTLLCLGAAVLVHPANFFLAIFLLVALAFRLFGHMPSPRRVPGLLLFIGGGLVVLGIVAYCFAPDFTRASIASRLLHFPWRRSWIRFGRNYLRLFSGMSSYRYVAGSCDWRTALPNGQIVDVHWWDIATAMLFAGAVFLLLFQSRRLESSAGRRNNEAEIFRRKDEVLLGFILASSLLFYVLNGPSWMGVSYERYAFWMVAPGVLLLARAAVVLTERWPRSRVLYLTSGLLLCWLLLLGFYLQYFRFMQITGGQSAMTFRTNSVEPKLAALQYILPRASVEKTTYIIATDWFVRWPLDYAVKTNPSAPDIRFLSNVDKEDAKLAQELEKTRSDNRVFYVEYANTRAAKKLRQSFRSTRSGHKEKIFLDYAGRPTISLFLPGSRDAQP